MLPERVVYRAALPESVWDDCIRSEQVNAKAWAVILGVEWETIHRKVLLIHQPLSAGYRAEMQIEWFCVV